MRIILGTSGISFLLLLSACSQLPNIPGVSSIVGGAGTLSVDPADPCHVQRQNFSDSQNFFAKAIYTKALQGATTNGMNSLKTGKVSNVFGTMLAGGVAGMKSGYLEALQQQNIDKQQLANQMNADLQREGLAIDHTTAAFATLRTCRLAQARRLKTEAQARRIDRVEIRRQLSQEHDWFAQEIAIAQDAGINMRKRDDQFAYAADSLHKQDTGAATPPAQPKTERAVTISATETIPQKRNSFESSVKEAQAESNTAFSLDTTAAARMRHYA